MHNSPLLFVYELLVERYNHGSLEVIELNAPTFLLSEPRSAFGAIESVTAGFCYQFSGQRRRVEWHVLYGV